MQIGKKKKNPTTYSEQLINLLPMYVVETLIFKVQVAWIALINNVSREKEQNNNAKQEKQSKLIVAKFDQLVK